MTPGTPTPAASPRAPVTHLLYLHGFRSSPQSFKAQLIGRRVAELADGGVPVQWCCPALPPSPHAAMERVLQETVGWPAGSSAVIGSSLGGFYAGIVAARLGWRAVLLNPAVHPARDLARYIGEQVGFHDPQARFFFRPEFISELKALALPRLPAPARHMAIVAKGDEVLDWREMATWCAGTHLVLREGGDHALSDFERAHLAEVLAFLGLPPH